jgi:hypothetical protein
MKDYRVGTVLERRRFARQTVHLAGLLKDQDTGDSRRSRTWISLPTHPSHSLERFRLTNHMVGGVVAGPGFDGWLFPGEPRRRR